MGIAEFIALVVFVLLLIGAAYLLYRRWQIYYSEQKSNIADRFFDVIYTLQASLKNDLTLSKEELEKLYSELIELYAALFGTAAATQPPSTEITHTLPTGAVQDTRDIGENCTLLCVTTEDIFSKYETLSDAEMTTPKELVIEPEQYLYGIVSAPANLTLIVRTENDSGQYHEWKITPCEQSAIKRHPFRVMYPSGGWHVGTDTIQVTLHDDAGIALDRITIPARVNPLCCS